MPDLVTPPLPQRPAAALAEVGALNHVTPREDSPQPHMPAPAVPPAGAQLDRFGVPFDAMIHEPGALAKDGHWKRKRGNGARVAAGKPIFVPPPTREAKPASDAPAAAAAPVAPAPAAAPGPTAPLASQLVLPGRPGPTPAGAAPLPELLPESAYDDTAENLTRGLWGMLEMMLGKAWRVEVQESAAYKSAFQRLWFQHQWPRLGPVISLVLLAVGSLSKRRDDPTTQKVGRTAWGWLRGMFGGRRAEDRAAAGAKPVEVEKTPDHVKARARG